MFVVAVDDAAVGAMHLAPGEANARMSNTGSRCTMHHKIRIMQAAVTPASPEGALPALINLKLSITL